MKLLFVLCRPVFGEEREERLDWASGILGREVTTFAELSSQEATALIKDMNGEVENEFSTGGSVSKSVNKVILVGNLGKDPDVKHTPGGVAVAKFSLATNERYKDKQGQWQDRTEWHNIVAWQRTAEIAGEYLKKGRSVYIEGRLQTRSWDDKESRQKKYMTEVVVENLVLLSGVAESNGDQGTRAHGAAASAGSRQPAGQPAASRTAEKNLHGMAITDEDIPF